MRGKDRHHFSAWGAAGGLAGTTCGNMGERENEAPHEIGKQTVYRPALGEVICIWGGGGGGWGDPLWRDSAAVAADVAAGLVSAERALATCTAWCCVTARWMLMRRRRNGRGFRQGAVRLRRLITARAARRGRTGSALRRSASRPGCPAWRRGCGVRRRRRCIDFLQETGPGPYDATVTDHAIQSVTARLQRQIGNGMSKGRYPATASTVRIAMPSRVMTITGGVIGNIIDVTTGRSTDCSPAVFAGQFFPQSDKIVALLLTLSTFALGFLMRPVGSIVLSPMADRYGRRRMLGLTILLMGMGSLIVAATPSYGAIGIAAPLLLLFARLLQGFSAVGEFQGGAAFLVEHAPPIAAGSRVPFISAASALRADRHRRFGTDHRADSAARFGRLGLAHSISARRRAVAVWLVYRTGLPETPHFVAAEQRDSLEKNPIMRALADYPWQSFVVFVMQMGTVQFYIWVVFLPTYAHIAGGLPLSQGFVGGIIALIVFCIATPWQERRRTGSAGGPSLLAYAIGFFVLAWPMLRLLENGDFWSFLLVDIVGCLLLAMADGVLSVTLCELFPTRVRTSGVGRRTRSARRSSAARRR